MIVADAGGPGILPDPHRLKSVLLTWLPRTLSGAIIRRHKRETLREWRLFRGKRWECETLGLRSG